MKPTPAQLPILPGLISAPRLRGSNNTAWIYVRASGSVATGTCTVASGTFLLTDASGPYTADTAFADREYGWVKLTAEDI